ncbi:MAG: DUF3089 domain-containing protein [Spirochaetes bacterium]|nr:DUF3089 domain-containing protein [Spirochaetota bacterium]
MKKALIIALSTIAVITAVVAVLVLNGERIFKSCIRPVEHFDSAAAPQAPDYGSEKNWAALPWKNEEADLVPEGAGTDGQAAAAADVFYIHPTGYYSKKGWNSPIDPGLSAYEQVRIMVAGQASPFNACCRVFAPHYREATLYSFMDTGADGRQALDLAYTDVARAFDYYITHYNRGRPFIIASHSQGSVHALRLLEEKIDRTALYEKLVAAYVIGYLIPVEKFERSFMRVGPCSGENDTGCLVTWNTYIEGSTPRRFGFIRYKSGWENVGEKEVLCVNPVTWKRDGAPSPVESHRGALFMKLPGLWKAAITGRPIGMKITVLPAPDEHRLSARCDRGFLFVPRQEELFEFFGRGNYHIFDYSLFYMDIRHNACVRVTEYCKRH